MVASTKLGLKQLAERLNDFVRSNDATIKLPADTSGSPSPYDKFLPSLEIEKSEGPLLTTIDPDKGITVTGAPHFLKEYCSYFEFPDNAEGGDHHHPESYLAGKMPGSLKRGTKAIIIEIIDTEES